MNRSIAADQCPASDEIYFAGSWDYTQIAFQERMASVMNGAQLLVVEKTAAAFEKLGNWMKM